MAAPVLPLSLPVMPHWTPIRAVAPCANPDMSDRGLVDACLAGEKESFDVLVRFSPRRFAGRLSQRQRSS